MEIQEQIQKFKEKLPPGYAKRIKQKLPKGHNIHLVYNVFQGKIKNPNSIKMVVAAAKEVIQEYEAEQKEVKKLITL